MALIVASAEISKSPAEVFAYVTDPTKLPEWQESVVRAECKEIPVRVGTRASVTRRIGRREMAQSAEIAELNPPTSWAVRGLDGPVRGNVNGTIEPFEDGARSRVTIELDLQGHRVGKLLLPLLVQRKAEKEMPRNMQKLKERLEHTE
jgi:uncharacterized protein YndB with AHSA1/START domain